VLTSSATAYSPVCQPAVSCHPRVKRTRAMERYDDALADFNRAIELNPSDEDHVAKRTDLYRLMGKYPLNFSLPSRGEAVDRGHCHRSTVL